MLVPPPRTSLASITPLSARAILGLTALVILFFIAVSQSQLRNRHLETVRDGGGADLRLYKAEIERVHQGESYYDVAADELRGRGYATSSIFNWRAPLLVEAIAALPSVTLARVALAGLAIAALWLSFGLLEQEAGSRAALGGALLMVGALLPAFMGEGYVLHEVWAATLIALSLSAHGRGRVVIAIAAGVAALFVREHAGLYCLLSLGLAVRTRSWREACGWVAGMTAYAVYFGWHAWTVSGLIGADELAQREGWLQFSGAPFVIAACQMNCLLLMLPQWVTAICLPCAMLGFLGWRTPWGERAGLVTAYYLMAFAIVGQPFNQYWGMLIAPPLALGLARAPAALVDLWRAAKRGAEISVAPAS